MHWYWEFSHYRIRTGDLILDRILGYNSPERIMPADFGVRLTGDNIDAHLAHSRAGIADWTARNPEFATQISAATKGRECSKSPGPGEVLVTRLFNLAMFLLASVPGAHAFDPHKVLGYLAFNLRCQTKRATTKVSPFVPATSKAADFPSPTSSSFRRFAVGLIAFVAIPPLALAALVVLVDPYYVFGTPNIPGINVVRPFYENHVPAVKPYQVRQIKPDAVILGSSRAEVALDPQHPGWAGKNVFNFGLPSATSYEVMLAFLHAQSSGSLKQAVVGLDFFGFNIFFPRDQEYLEARFSGNGVQDFADFLTAELAKRRPDDGSKPYPPFAPPAPEARKEVSPAALEEAAADAVCKDADRENCTRNGLAESGPPANWNEALYLRLHPDVAAAVQRHVFTSGYQHYLAAGHAEGRQSGTPPRDWNDAQYLRIYPDVAAEVRRGTFISGYHHYLAAGRAEGRQSGTPPPGWNDAQYLRIYSDAAAEVRRGTFISGYHHYLVAGRAEGRQDGTPPRDWDEERYLRVNPNVQKEIARGTFISGYHHYLIAGKPERREGGFTPPDWNERSYLQVNRDVEYQIAQGLFLNGYHHYLAAGRAEKRTGGFRPDGWNEANYLSRNPCRPHPVGARRIQRRLCPLRRCRSKAGTDGWISACRFIGNDRAVLATVWKSDVSDWGAVPSGIFRHRRERYARDPSPAIRTGVLQRSRHAHMGFAGRRPPCDRRQRPDFPQQHPELAVVCVAYAPAIHVLLCQFRHRHDRFRCIPLHGSARL